MEEASCSQDVTCLLEYRFENLQLTKLNSDKEGDLIYVGTNTGEIFVFFLCVKPTLAGLNESAEIGSIGVVYDKDINRSPGAMIYEKSFMQAKENQKSRRLKFSMCRESIIQAHKEGAKLIEIISKIRRSSTTQKSRQLVYSLADDKRLVISDSKKKVYEVKYSNFKPKCMALHATADILYIAMREGLIVVLDVSSIEPVVLHSIYVSVPTSRIYVDPVFNCLLVLNTDYALIKLQLSTRDPCHIEEIDQVNEMKQSGFQDDLS